MLELDSIKNRVDLSRLMSLFQRDKNTIFVDKDGYIGELKPKSTLILSPSFYWVKKEQLPVKYSFEVKKLLPSLFDGLLPDGEYSYKAIKESGNSYILLAYSDKDIVQNLLNLGIKEIHIGEIYFAQSEFLGIDTPLAFKDSSAFVNQDGIICKIPISFVENAQDIGEVLRNKRLTKEKISVNIFSHSIIDTKSIKKGTIVVLVVIVALFTKYFLYQQTLNELNQKSVAIAKNYNLPPTQIQLNAMKTTLIRKSQQEIGLRDKISYILNTPLTRDIEYFKNISVTKRAIIFEIELQEPKRAEVLRDYLQKELAVDRIRVVDSVMKVEVKS